LPHNYGKGPSNSVEPQDKERRASPLFFHIHQMSDKSEPRGLVSFLPARFLPPGEGLSSFGKLVKLKDGEPSWKPIEDFLSRLLGQPGVKPLQDNSLKSKEVKLG
jgi:CRISPR-associated protein Cmr1